MINRLCHDTCMAGDRLRVNLTVDDHLDPVCWERCDPEFYVERLTESFVDAAADTGAVGESESERVICQARCEGPFTREGEPGLLCGMVALYQLLEPDGSVRLQGTFHNIG